MPIVFARAWISGANNCLNVSICAADRALGGTVCRLRRWSISIGRERPRVQARCPSPIWRQVAARYFSIRSRVYSRGTPRLGIRTPRLGIRGSGAFSTTGADETPAPRGSAGRWCGYAFPIPAPTPRGSRFVGAPSRRNVVQTTSQRRSRGVIRGREHAD